MKRILVYSILCFLCISCELINGSVVKEEVIVAQEKESIDLETVDQFPSFPACDALSEEVIKKCFLTTLSAHIQTSLSQHNLVVSETLHDTLYVHLQVDKSGVITADSISNQRAIQKQLPTIDRIIFESVKALPSVSPAHKRAIPVITKFKLPIILHVNE